jgi:hypothetical protein
MEMSAASIATTDLETGSLFMDVGIFLFLHSCRPKTRPRGLRCEHEPGFFPVSFRGPAPGPGPVVQSADILKTILKFPEATTYLYDPVGYAPEPWALWFQVIENGRPYEKSKR